MHTASKVSLSLFDATMELRSYMPHDILFLSVRLKRDAWYSNSGVCSNLPYTTSLSSFNLMGMAYIYTRVREGFYIEPPEPLP